jgi:hypothetical protein
MKRGYFTRFGLTAGGREVARALLPEAPQPAEGTTLTAVLDDSNDDSGLENWTNVYGWRNHDTGMHYVGSWAGSLFYAWFLLLVTLVMGYEATLYWPVFLFVAFLLAFAVMQSRPVYSLFCAKRLLAQQP